MSRRHTPTPTTHPTRLTTHPGGTHPHPRDTLHPSIRLTQDLHAIANTWPALTTALTPRPTNTHTARITGTTDRPLPITAHVSDLMREISEWAWFLARILHSETQGENRWQPPTDHTTPVLLAAIATRTGHLTEHPDRDLATAVQDDATAYRRRADAVIEPTGARWVPLHIACIDNTTTGEPCPGMLRCRLQPDRWWSLSDLVCDTDHTHRITPDTWQRLTRRSRDLTPEQTRDFLRRIRARTGVS